MPPQAREVSLPGAAELLQKLSQAETEEDKEAVRKAMVESMIHVHVASCARESMSYLDLKPS